MSRCAACGHEYPPESKYCTGCGAATAPPASESVSSCPACRAANPARSKFCVHCGAPLQPSPPPPPAFCTSCGAPAPTGGKFCPGCGAAVASASESIPSGQGAAPGGPAVLEVCLAGLEARLVQNGFSAEPVPSAPPLDRVYRRKKIDIAKAGMLTTVCGIRIIPSGVDGARIRQFSEEVFKLATAGKGVIIRNTFQPVLAYPVIITSSFPAEVETFLNSYWPKHMMAYEYPVVIGATAGQIAMHRSTPVWAIALHGGIKKEAERLFSP